MNWESPQRPAELTESRLIAAILDGTFPINSPLPAERELSDRLGVTRPTLREALQRLGRDGWLEIHQGKPTRVRNYWQEGNLGLLNAITPMSDKLPPTSSPNSSRCASRWRPSTPRWPSPATRLKWSGSWRRTFPRRHCICLFRGRLVAAPPPDGRLCQSRLHPDTERISNLYRLFGPLYFTVEANRRHSETFYRELGGGCPKKTPERPARSLCAS